MSHLVHFKIHLPTVKSLCHSHKSYLRPPKISHIFLFCFLLLLFLVVFGCFWRNFEMMIFVLCIDLLLSNTFVPLQCAKENKGSACL